jgi:hypothetical protein
MDQRLLHMYEPDTDENALREISDFPDGEDPPFAPTEMNAICIAACPPGKHDVSLCEEYERIWRRWYLPLLTALVEPTQHCMCFASGPMYGGGLPAFINDVIDADTQYTIERVSCLEPGGYVYGHMRLLLGADALSRAIGDERLDLELVRLRAVVVAKERTQSVLEMSIRQLTKDFVLRSCEFGIAPFPHFEGMTVFGLPDNVARVTSLLQNRFPDAF